MIEQLIDFILHIDKHLVQMVTDYQTWTYLILFAIIFCETGLVVTPFLPGDSLLFATGALSAMDTNPINVYLIIPLLIAAAFIGDNTNYWIGRYLGKKVYEKNYRLIRRKYLDKTKVFYDKHGAKTLVFARFMPILRTFAPFVAGVGTMNYSRFLTFSIIGNVIWVNLFTWAGYIFADNKFVKNNFSIVIIAIIIISLLPPVFAVLREKFRKKQ
jgi:membrane-associated protein